VVMAVLVASVVLPGSSGRRPGPISIGPRPAAASEVRARVAQAFATAHALRGELTMVCEVAVGPCAPPDHGRATLRWSFVADDAGDERVTGIGRQDDVAYDAGRGGQRVLSPGGRGPAAVEVVNLSAGPPDFPAQPSVLRRGLASVVRAFLAGAGDSPVTETSVDGRSAWQLVTPVTPNKLAGGTSGDQLDVTVDRQTGFPLRITETLAGRFLQEIRLSGLVVNGPVDQGAFSLTFPPGTRAFVQDAGFRRLPLDQVAAAVGYQPLLPKTVPDGYRLAEVTVARQSQPTGSEGANPVSRNVVSVAYRRGFDRIVVTTRSTGPRASAWADPLATGEGFFDQPQRFTVATGSMAGAKAELVLAPRGLAHVWAVDQRLVVTVAGDATGDELTRMIDSF